MAPVNLAPLRYRRILERDGGPIANLAVWPSVRPRGGGLFSASATLSACLRPSWRAASKIYGDSDGGGTSAYRSVACFIAISEALDRWAFYSECEGPSRERLGFHMEPSTTGLAAFPGLTSAGAQRHARLEALERWAVTEWWLGRLSARQLPMPGAGEGAVRILTPFPEDFVVITWIPCSFSGLTFGFAADRTLKGALTHAGIERARNVKVLEKLFGSGATKPDDYRRELLESEEERRLVYFATPAGEAAFRQRLEASRSVQGALAAPRLLVDCEVKGPWSKWATVWRVLFEQTSYSHLDPGRDDFFLF